MKKKNFLLKNNIDSILKFYFQNLKKSELDFDKVENNLLNNAVNYYFSKKEEKFKLRKLHKIHLAYLTT